MKLRFLLGFFLFCFCLRPCLQAQVGNIGCQTDDYNQRLTQANPAMAGQAAAFETLIYQKTMDKLAKAKSAAAPQPMADPVYIVPVVVHIVHNNGTENISDAEVQTAIDRMNMVFSNTNLYNHPAAVDVGIQFCLAVQDPNGNPTTGINRVVNAQYTDLDYPSENAGLKALGFWPSTDYMNIWLVKSISNGVFAFSSLAGAAGSASDGVVCLANRFLPTNSLADKLIIHELGHYFNLLHTFEGGCANNNCLTDGDKVCDTPPVASPQQPTGCSITYHDCSACAGVPNTCATDADDADPRNPFRSTALGGLGDQTDMYQNYLSYSMTNCWNRFTPGQRERMRLSVELLRYSLLSSKGCVPEGSKDLAILDIVSPEKRVCAPPLLPKIKLKNQGGQTISAAQIEVKLDDVVQYIFTYNGSLAANQEEVVTLTAVSGYGAGSHTLEANILSVNGGADAFAGNNLKTKTFEYVLAAQPGFCLDFNANANLPAQWLVSPANPNIKSFPSICAAQSAALGFDFWGGNHLNAYLSTPVLDLSNVTSPAALTFKVAYKRTHTNCKTTLKVLVLPCNQTADTVYSKTSFSGLETVTGTELSTAWAPAGCAEWRSESINLNAYIGQKIRLEIQVLAPEACAQNLYLDDLCFKACGGVTAAATPSTLCAGQTATLSAAGADTYVWSGGLGAGATQTVSPTATTTYTVTGTTGSCTATAAVTVTVNGGCNTLTLNLKTYLEGCYNAAAQTMVSGVQTFLPTTQPHASAPFFYNGTENVAAIPANAIDWVLVELRSAANVQTVVERKAALLYADGSLTADFNVAPGNYYVSVAHRNHLTIGFKNTVASPGVAAIDLTAPANIQGGANFYATLPNGAAALPAGDCANDGYVSHLDYNLWFAANSQYLQYLSPDFNFDGYVTFADFVLWLKNNSKISYFPINLRVFDKLAAVLWALCQEINRAFILIEF